MNLRVMFPWVTLLLGLGLAVVAYFVLSWWLALIMVVLDVVWFLLALRQSNQPPPPPSGGVYKLPPRQK